MFAMKTAPYWINFNRSRRNLQNRCLQQRRKFESSFVQWKSKVSMDFVGGVFLKKLVEIRTDYYTGHSANTYIHIYIYNIYIYISLRISRTADWRKGKSGRETVREGYVMNSWIFFIVQVTTFSDIKATLHTNPIHVLTAAWSSDYCRSKRFFWQIVWMF